MATIAQQPAFRWRVIPRALIPCCFAAACGAYGNDETFTDSGVTGEEAVALSELACRQRATAICKYMFRCFSAEDWEEVALAVEDEASCPETMRAEMCAEGLVVTPFADGRRVFHQSRVVECIATIEAAECMAPADFFTHPDHVLACEFARGTVPAGGECSNWADCEGDYPICTTDGICEVGSSTDYERECDVPVDEGECPGGTCASFFPNAQGLSGTCTRLCTADHHCGRDGVCVSVNGGGLCLSVCIDDGDCSGGLVCVHGEGKRVGRCMVDAL